MKAHACAFHMVCTVGFMWLLRKMHGGGKFGVDHSTQNWVVHVIARYGTARSKFGNIVTKFGNGHGIFKLCSPSGQPHTWGHLGGACRVPLAHKVWHSG